MPTVRSLLEDIAATIPSQTGQSGSWQYSPILGNIVIKAQAALAELDASREQTEKTTELIEVTHRDDLNTVTTTHKVTNHKARVVLDD